MSITKTQERLGYQDILEIYTSGCKEKTSFQIGVEYERLPICVNSGVAVDYDFYNRLIRVTDVVKMYGYPTGVWRMMANVSQHKSTVLTCVEYGDVLKRETLKDLKLSFFSNIYECYIRAFDRQHVQSWFAEMKKGQPLEEDLKKCSIIDICVYKMIRLFLTI